MSSVLQDLPPEMQARLAAIVNGQAPGMAKVPEAPKPQPQAPEPQWQQQQPAPEPAPAPPAQPKPPSLYEHIVALRQEVAHISQVQQANAQVITAIGQAVGQMYQMFQPATQSAQGGTYSQNFQSSAVDEEDSDY